MYVAEQFQMPGADARNMVQTSRYGNLVTVAPDGRPVATFLPWAFAPDPDRLLTHVARVNTQWTHVNGPALVVFDGLHGPVEADWKAGFDIGQSSPGLDYEAVHVWGELVASDDPAAIFDSWDRLIVAHETKPRTAEMDQDWLARLAKATIAVEVRITEVQAKSKLSQAQCPADIRHIADQTELTCPALAARIREVALPYAERREALVAGARQSGGYTMRGTKTND
ncbi:MAG: FMN-binding negative transcriptional regulator [Propionibacteriaceae bacterium]|jgi:transcriptional regulator|nr:FMN-binding negative transcriptional regulator [Propionibacteriaceae bacterium]